MNKNFEKDRLCLAYQRLLYHLNAVLLLGTVGLLSFFGTFIWNRDYLVIGFMILIVIFIISISFYKKINKELKNISNQIKNL